MKRSLALLLLAFLLTAATPAPAWAAHTVHVVVALCDNVHQGIVPVPPRLGNGDDPAQNLYWGAAYGVKTFMGRQPGWKLARTDKNPAPHVLERAVFQNTALGVTMVADAYQGKAIKEATVDFLAYASGKNGLDAALGKETVRAGGASHLVVYVGHNGLMDFSLESLPPVRSAERRVPADAAIFACQSKAFFADVLKNSGSYPLIWTRGNMAPEAYSLHALVTAWAKGEKPAAVQEAVAQAYDKYQKCGIRGARNLFATGW